MLDKLSVKRIVTKDASGQENGWMIPIFKKDDAFFSDYDMNFVYASSVAGMTAKGPHLHKKRECRLIAIEGEVSLVVKVKEQYEEYALNSKNPEIVVIKAGQPFCVYNRSDLPAILLNFANHIWAQDDTDNYRPENWTYPNEVR